MSIHELVFISLTTISIIIYLLLIVGVTVMSPSQAGYGQYRIPDICVAVHHDPIQSTKKKIQSVTV